MLNATGSNAIDIPQYTDGLGRVVQTNLKRWSGDSNNDMVKRVEYDAYNRLYKEWTPAAIANDGNMVSDLSLFDIPFDAAPYSMQTYTGGPMDLPKVWFGAAYAWHAA